MNTKIHLFWLCIFSAVMLCAAEAEKKIVFIGDSIACGVGASTQEKRFSTLAVAKLNGYAGKNLYREINLAWSGSTMTDQPWPHPESSAYPRRIAAALAEKPDILVIEHGVNDNALARSAADFGWSYRTFIREIRKALPDCTIVCMTFCPGKRESAQWHAEANVAIQEIAALEGTLLAHADMAIGNRLELFPDGTHPNDEGHAILAEVLAETIRKNEVQSQDSFEFAVGYPGEYRICGWRFTVSPEAVGKSFVFFSKVSTGGWNYSAGAAVTVRSPHLSYPEKPAFGSLQVDWQGYLKRITITLPAAENAVIRKN